MTNPDIYKRSQASITRSEQIDLGVQIERARVTAILSHPRGAQIFPVMQVCVQQGHALETAFKVMDSVV